MKRVFLAAALFFSVAIVRAEYSPSFQSTRTCAAEANLLVATGSIKLVSIIVDSPTVNNSSFLTIHDSTTSASGGYNPNRSTFSYLSTNATAIIGNFPAQFAYNQNTSSGVVINKQGAACTEVFWHFVTPEIELEGISGRIPALSNYRP